VIYEPLLEVSRVRSGRGGRSRTLIKNPTEEGYRVTVPLLPGLITYGRTLDEAREMARDAIQCHLEGLQKDGERIPNERFARKEKLRVAIGA
jgi:predicted RNase H-like HicB family nuclease